MERISEQNRFYIKTNFKSKQILRSLKFKYFSNLNIYKIWTLSDFEQFSKFVQF
jgi:hypothetical protein